MKIVETRDGSSTLFSDQSGDYYHSLHGAETESNYVFIEKGLKQFLNSKKEINLLEVGLGTGLNLCLTYNVIKNLNIKKVNYVALEPFPIDLSIAEKLNFDVLKKEKVRDLYRKLHELEWNTEEIVDPQFAYRKNKVSLQNFESDRKFDLVYYDAFGPSYQKEMWESPIVEKISSIMQKDSVLVTYCAQGQFRRNLESFGLKVERLDGPPGKREMIRAYK